MNRRLKKSREDEKTILKLVNRERWIQNRVGSKKLYLDIKPDLNNLGLKYGRDKVHAVIKKNDMHIKPRKNYRKTTNSHHRFRMFKNEIINLNISKPEQVFVNDITYIKVKNTFAYLFLTTDAYSKKIMGYSINYTMKVKDGLKAIKMAHKNRKFKNPVYHHSDRGIQYCTPSYIQFIKNKNMIPSMTENDHVYENSIAERLNGILKQEYGIDLGFASLKHARSIIDKSISIYNNKRRHMSIGFLTPNFVHCNPNIDFKNVDLNTILYCNRISG